MRIARGRLDLRVAEQAPDYRQTLPERQRPERVTVSNVMNPHVREPRPLAHDVPGVVQVAHRRPAPDLPQDHVRIIRRPQYPRQHVHRFRGQHDRPRPGLRVLQLQLARLQVHPVPAQVQNLPLASADQESGHATWGRPISAPDGRTPPPS